MRKSSELSQEKYRAKYQGKCVRHILGLNDGIFLDSIERKITIRPDFKISKKLEKRLEWLKENFNWTINKQ